MKKLGIILSVFSLNASFAFSSEPNLPIALPFIQGLTLFKRAPAKTKKYLTQPTMTFKSEPSETCLSLKGKYRITLVDSDLPLPGPVVAEQNFEADCTHLSQVNADGSIQETIETGQTIEKELEGNHYTLYYKPDAQGLKTMGTITMDKPDSKIKMKLSYSYIINQVNEKLYLTLYELGTVNETIIQARLKFELQSIP